MAWDPAQYLKFAGHRLRPALDLLSRIDAAGPAVVYDLGAGAGNVTRLLRERWPGARITGVDESEDMLVKARAAAPDIARERADLDALDPREHEAFEARYDAVVDRAYPRRPDGRTLFPFRRMFIVASAGQP